MSAPGPRLRKGGLRKAGAAVGTTFVFVVAAGAGVLLHLDSPLARRVIVARVSGVLEGVFEGKLTIERSIT